MNGAFSLRMLKMKQGLLWGFLICLFFSSTILATNWSAKASLDEYTYYIIKGDGMRPTIELEDLVTVKTNINKSQISAAPQPDGDIIAFHRPKATSLDSSAVILHSYIDVSKSWSTITQDLHTTEQKETIEKTQIIGVTITEEKTTLGTAWYLKIF